MYAYIYIYTYIYKYIYIHVYIYIYVFLSRVFHHHFFCCVSIVYVCVRGTDIYFWFRIHLFECFLFMWIEQSWYKLDFETSRRS